MLAHGQMSVWQRLKASLEMAITRQWPADSVSVSRSLVFAFVFGFYAQDKDSLAHSKMSTSGGSKVN